jgi:ProP effector
MAGDGKNAEATIGEIVAAFPAAFTLDPALIRPLKLGIRDDLYATSDISHRRISAALARYCRSPSYLKVLAEGAVRVDLAGKPAGMVTAAEATAARKPRVKRGAQAPKEDGPGEPATGAVTPGQGRLSLGDLRRAAAARKSAR